MPGVARLVHVAVRGMTSSILHRLLVLGPCRTERGRARAGSRIRRRRVIDAGSAGAGIITREPEDLPQPAQLVIEGLVSPQELLHDAVAALLAPELLDLPLEVLDVLLRARPDGPLGLPVVGALPRKLRRSERGYAPGAWWFFALRVNLMQQQQPSHGGGAFQRVRPTLALVRFARIYRALRHVKRLGLRGCGKRRVGVRLGLSAESHA